MDFGSMLLSGTSVILLLATGIQFFRTRLRDLHSSVNVFWHRQSEKSRLRLVTQRLRLSGELQCQAAPPDNKNGAAWRVLEVKEIHDESADCRSYYLSDPNGNDLPSFQAGQFVSVRPALGGSGKPTRCYSLSDWPNSSGWRITVKRVTSADGLSDWLHRRVGIGDCLLVGGPFGEFVLDTTSQAPIIFLAAGIGITPLICMLKQALAIFPNRDVNLYFQIQDEDHWPFGPMLHTWQSACPRLQVTSYFSRIDSTEMLPKVEHGAVQIGKFGIADVLRNGFDHSHCDYYLCGPVEWMKRLTDDLIGVNVPPERIRSESFGGPTSGNISAPEAVKPWSLRFARSGLAIPANTQTKSIWEAAHENGLELPAACHSGACGSCRTKLLTGNVEYRTKPTCSISTDEVLACIAHPLDDVILDA